MTKRREDMHMLMAFTGNAIFNFSFLFSKLAMDTAEPFVLLSMRFPVAFCLMNVLRLLGEHLSPVQAVGIVMVIVGVYGVNR